MLGIYYFEGNQINQPNISFGNPVTKEPVSLTLNLTSPDDNILVFDSNLLVQGTTSKDALVILSSNSDDQILKVSHRGEFSTTIKLQEGLNKFIISSSDATGLNKQESRTVYYSKDKI